MLKMTLIIFGFLLTVSSAHAEKISTRFCENMLNNSSSDVSLETRLDSVVDGLNEGFAMSLTTEQTVKVKTKLQALLTINSKKINDLENTAAMPCFLDMTVEERAEAGQQLKQQLEL